MNLSIRVTFDDLTRALRTTAHSLADAAEARRHPGSTDAGTRPARPDPSEDEETGYDLRRR